MRALSTAARQDLTTAVGTCSCAELEMLEVNDGRRDATVLQADDGYVRSVVVRRPSNDDPVLRATAERLEPVIPNKAPVSSPMSSISGLRHGERSYGTQNAESESRSMGA
jgi:hypothetical protein